MWHQDHLRPYDPSARFPDGASARTPPAHTVPAGPLPSARPPSAPVTLAELRRGRECFDAECSECHGTSGYGDGIVVQRGFPAPPSFHQPRLRAAPSSHFYDVLVHGYGIMVPAAPRVAPADRWAIVAYIRALQLSQHAGLADVPPAERALLEKP